MPLNPLPETPGDLSYAVLVQLLAAAREMTEQLGDVRAWQRDLRVQQNLGEVESGLDTLKQVKQENGIRA